MNDVDNAQPPSNLLMMMEARAMFELGAFYACLPWLYARLPRGDGHPVLVLPGFAGDDLSTQPLRTMLRGLGHEAYAWEGGHNLGPGAGAWARNRSRLEALHRKHGERVSLVGWSLGGLYARQLAALDPDHVRFVVTLGSPVRGNLRASNAWEMYEAMTGRAVDDFDEMGGARFSDPPVRPSTSVFSRSDGVVSWACCMDEEGPNSENVEVRTSHCGIGFHPAALYVVADRLAQPEADWRPFDRNATHYRPFVFPDPGRFASAPGP